MLHNSASWQAELHLCHNLHFNVSRKFLAILQSLLSRMDNTYIKMFSIRVVSLVLISQFLTTQFLIYNSNEKFICGSRS